MELNITKKISYFGIGIALYVVLSCIVNVPLLAGSHLQTDFGYIVFGAFLYIFGWQAIIIGVIGCLLKSLLISGWIPIGWMLGQVLIGVMCGIVYKKTKNKIIWILVTVLAVFIGIGIIKTVVECLLYQIPFVVKFSKNCVAVIADILPMLGGLYIGNIIKVRVVK